MTFQQARNLYINMGEAIKQLEPNVDILANTLKNIEKVSEFDNYTMNVLKNALSCQLCISLIYLDICAATRLYLSGSTNYDQRFALKNLQAILNEGYKRVYGFQQTKQNETIIYSLTSILAEEDKNKYRIFLDNLSSIKSKFYEPTIFNKESRCLVYHYSNELLKTHRFLSDLNAEVIVHASNEFLGVLKELSAFVHKLALDFDGRLTDKLNLIRNNFSLGSCDTVVALS